MEVASPFSIYPNILSHYSITAPLLDLLYTIIYISE